LKQIFATQGEVIVEDIPEPVPLPGEVLVQTAFSCISSATEMSSLQKTGQGILRKVLNPDIARKVFASVRSRGLSATFQMGQDRQKTRYALGYSASGVVTGVGEGVIDVQIGERVACAGTGYAIHAGAIRVPRNLLVKIPENVSMEQASTVALGAIALQGIRRAECSLGEWVVVYGLGLLGQLTVQMLKANGCQVIGIDLLQERVALAISQGLDVGIETESGNVPEQVRQITGGVGADEVIISAASRSSEIVSQAFKSCRKKGRVIMVGDVGLELNRNDLYAGELDLLTATSYGPGRYDEAYEVEGRDYPIAYVRWTENRNMQAYLHLIGSGQVKLDALISDIYPVEDAPVAFAALRRPDTPPLLVLLRYVEFKDTDTVEEELPAQHKDTIILQARPGTGRDRIRIAVVGAGTFARGVHLPNIKRLKRLFDLRAVVNRTGHGARFAAEKFSAGYATTNFEKVLNDSEIDAVLISTRHDLHAEMALKALRAGKHVLVEKPLALNREELKSLQGFYESGSKHPLLLAGFNRRFSEPILKVHSAVNHRTNPLMIAYRVNAGYIPFDHWIHSEEGGGRNLGEACHFYDLFTFLTGAELQSVEVKSLALKTDYYSFRDNFQTVLSFSDGSVCSLLYTAAGNPAVEKERMEVFCDGRTLVLNDYRRLETYGRRNRIYKFGKGDKGQVEELKQFATAILEAGDWPIPLWEMIQATEIAFQVEDLLKVRAV